MFYRCYGHYIPDRSGWGTYFQKSYNFVYFIGEAPRRRVLDESLKYKGEDAKRRKFPRLRRPAEDLRNNREKAILIHAHRGGDQLIPSSHWNANRPSMHLLCGALKCSYGRDFLFDESAIHRGYYFSGHLFFRALYEDDHPLASQLKPIVDGYFTATAKIDTLLWADGGLAADLRYSLETELKAIAKEYAQRIEAVIQAHEEKLAERKKLEEQAAADKKEVHRVESDFVAKSKRDINNIEAQEYLRS